MKRTVLKRTVQYILYIGGKCRNLILAGVGGGGIPITAWGIPPITEQEEPIT